MSQRPNPFTNWGNASVEEVREAHDAFTVPDRRWTRRGSSRRRSGRGYSSYRSPLTPDNTRSTPSRGVPDHGSSMRGFGQDADRGSRDTRAWTRYHLEGSFSPTSMRESAVPYHMPGLHQSSNVSAGSMSSRNPGWASNVMPPQLHRQSATTNPATDTTRFPTISEELVDVSIPEPKAEAIPPTFLGKNPKSLPSNDTLLDSKIEVDNSRLISPIMPVQVRAPKQQSLLDLDSSE